MYMRYIVGIRKRDIHDYMYDYLYVFTMPIYRHMCINTYGRAGQQTTPPSSALAYDG